jgi:hypothetical protein
MVLPVTQHQCLVFVPRSSLNIVDTSSDEHEPSLKVVVVVSQNSLKLQLSCLPMDVTNRGLVYVRNLLHSVHILYNSELSIKTMQV